MSRRRRKRPHGTGTCYRRESGSWCVQWTDENGKRHTRTMPTEDEARSFMAKACAGLVPARPRADTMASLAEAWLAGREEMPSSYDDRNRWKNHLAPLLGGLTPHQVTVAELKVTIATLRGKGLAKSTTGLCIALLSSLFGELVEDGVAQINPVRLLSKKTRRQHLTSDCDRKKTPFLRERADITRVYRKLRDRHEGVARAYIIGALAGLRTGEVRALRWKHVDLERRLIHVQDQVARRSGGVSTLKDGESRFVPISDALYEVLANALIEVGSLVCQPAGHSEFLSDHLIGKLIAAALAELELPAMRWYEATRHTFASQWVMEGGSLETLREMMGHDSVTTTERYAHLIPGRFTDADRARVSIQLEPFEKAMVN